MLRVLDLCKSFQLPNRVKFQAVRSVRFHVPKGSFFTLLGPSGCGKTTILRSIAGLERPEAGSIMIAEHRVFDHQQNLFVPPNKRQIGMVFQSYAIWPHMNVFENVAFPLRVGSRLSRAEIASRVNRVLATVHLDGYAERASTRLSGGQHAKVTFVVDRRSNVLTVPNEALQSNEGVMTLYVVKGDTARTRTVNIGISNDAVAEVASGLSNGDEVVVIGQGFLSDGYPITRSAK